MKTNITSPEWLIDRLFLAATRSPKAVNSYQAAIIAARARELLQLQPQELCRYLRELAEIHPRIKDALEPASQVVSALYDNQACDKTSEHAESAARQYVAIVIATFEIVQVTH